MHTQIYHPTYTQCHAASANQDSAVTPTPLSLCYPAPNLTSPPSIPQHRRWFISPPAPPWFHHSGAELCNSNTKPCSFQTKEPLAGCESPVLLMGQLLTCLGVNNSLHLSYKAHRCEGKLGTGLSSTPLLFLAAYREASHVYQISVRFNVKGCELAANDRFVEELKKILENLISDLTCRVEGPSSTCHSLEAPQRGSPNELFITFQGNRTRCSRRSDGLWP